MADFIHNLLLLTFKHYHLRSLLGIVWVLGWAVGPGAPITRAESVDPPPFPREFRGVWVATVNNLDWPSKPGLPVKQQKEELIAILDRAKRLNLNAVIFQVRPACDAFYKSKYEPWSEYLMGRMGEAPHPFYDPLSFAIREAHRRGLELHAWFNPFRARFYAAKGPASPDHVSRRHPSWVRHYGRQLWLDPGLPQVRAYTLAVIMDVVHRYDIDGVHLDDYFYPYLERTKSGRPIDFPDRPSWRLYKSEGGHLDPADWRRENIDQFIRELYRKVKAAKPWVKVGISPFGIWRPGFPPSVKGLDAYNQLYADSRKWLKEGWVDYLAPQLYWSISSKRQSFTKLLGWWAAQNTEDRHLWPGLNAAAVGKTFTAGEILRQILATRRQHGSNGEIFWDMDGLDRNADGLRHKLEQTVYAHPALIPASPWLESSRPRQPKLVALPVRKKNDWQLTWTATGPKKVALWALQSRSRGKWSQRVLPAEVVHVLLSQLRLPGSPNCISLAAVDRYGNESPPVTAILQSEARTVSFSQP